MALASKKSGEDAQKHSTLQDATALRKKAAARKVIKLFAEQRQRRNIDLSEEDREELVIEFRMKARKLGRSILRKWHARLDLQEVDSVVDLSLCEAVRRFDPTKGASFMTFLYYHLKGNLIRTVSAAANASGYRVAGDNFEEVSEYQFSQGRSVNAIEVAEALSGTEVETPDEALFKKELIELSLAACKKLDTLEQQVIERLYIDEEQLMDIAHSLGYSRCHISRVKKKALEALQTSIQARLGIKQEEKALTRIEKRAVHRRRPRSVKARELKKRAKNTDQLERIAAVG